MRNLWLITGAGGGIGAGTAKTALRRRDALGAGSIPVSSARIRLRLRSGSRGGVLLHSVT